MANFLPCLANETDRAMISKASKQKLHCFDVPMKLLRKWKKAKNRCPTANTSTTSKPVLQDHLEKGTEKGVIRLKVVLTKEEAARLLSMCMRGEEKTLAHFMSQLESRHASAVTLGSSHGGWRPVLESIPEEYC